MQPAGCQAVQLIHCSVSLWVKCRRAGHAALSHSWVDFTASDDLRAQSTLIGRLLLSSLFTKESFNFSCALEPRQCVCVCDVGWSRRHRAELLCCPALQDVPCRVAEDASRSQLSPSMPRALGLTWHRGRRWPRQLRRYHATQQWRDAAGLQTHV